MDAGYYKKDPAIGQTPDKQYNNDWSGKWTGKNGINSKSEFMNSRIKQDIAISEYHKIVWGYLKDYHKYDGQEIGGIKITKSGMIVAGHLVGHKKVREFIDSKGKINPEDKNGTTCYEYLKGFGGYEVDYSALLNDY